MQPYEKPIPVPDPVTGPFWEAAKQGRLVIQHCPNCGAHQFYPQSSCRGCLSDGLEWVEASGKGTIYSYLPDCVEYEVFAHYSFSYKAFNIEFD